MLGYWRPHREYQVWLEQKLLSFLPEKEQEVRYYEDILEKVYVLDLDKLFFLAKDRYSFTGRPANNQPEVFRTLVVMSHFKQGITSFVKSMRAHDALAAVCGFEPDAVPGVGTFYDFLNRFWLAEEPAKVLREPFKKKGKKPKKGEKLNEEDPGCVAELVNKMLDGYLFDGPQNLLQRIFTECAVKPSLELELCGDPLKMVLAGDGTPLETGAGRFGKKVCSCKKQGIYKCSCPRMYTSSTANWGWDSYHERWFYGHTLYCITAADSANDLPLAIHLTQGSRHDSVTFVPAYARLRELYPELRFEAALLDSAHDAYDIYRLLLEHDIEPFIDLNKRNTGSGNLPAFEVNDLGQPVCLEGMAMVYNGVDKNRRRIKWRCPMHFKPDDCIEKEKCSPSPYGRVVYTKPKDDIRLFTQTPRGSKAWKKAYARRTAVERTIKRIMVDYMIESFRFRAERRWFWFASLAAMNMHLDAQVRKVGQVLFGRLGLKEKAA